MVIGMAKTAFYSQPMYGAFDMAEDAVQPEATQRQRQQRPRAQIAEEKRPQQLTQQVVVGEDKGAQKLQRIMEQITEVSSILNILSAFSLGVSKKKLDRFFI